MDWINVLKEVIKYFKPRLQVKFEVWVEGKVIYVKNVSKRKAYDVRIVPSENTFWRFNYNKPIDFESNRLAKISFTQIHGETKIGSLTIIWRSKSNGRQHKMIYPITL